MQDRRCYSSRRHRRHRRSSPDSRSSRSGTLSPERLPRQYRRRDAGVSPPSPPANPDPDGVYFDAYYDPAYYGQYQYQPPAAAAYAYHPLYYQQEQEEEESGGMGNTGGYVVSGRGGVFHKPAMQCFHWDNPNHLAQSLRDCKFWHPRERCRFYPNCNQAAEGCGYAHPFCGVYCECEPGKRDPQKNHRINKRDGPPPPSHNPRDPAAVYRTRFYPDGVSPPRGGGRGRSPSTDSG